MKRIIKISITSLLIVGLVSPSFASIDKNLKYGETGTQVSELQEFLIDKGLLKGAAQGFFGILTLKAVKVYQKTIGLSPTGFVGAATRQKINASLSSEIANSLIAEKNEPSQGVATTPQQSNLFKGKTVSASDYVEGSSDSKVVVVEYSDPECPFCIMFHPTIKQIRAEYKDKIAFVYRHFPLTQIHPLAFDEARAISCAGKIGGVGKYYAYLDAYYDMRMSTWQSTKSQQPPELTVSGKEELIKTASIDSTSFSSCMTNNETSELVKTSILDGQTITADGSPVVSGTPSTYVLKKGQNGYEVVTKIDGARPYEFVKAAIDQALLK